MTDAAVNLSATRLQPFFADTGRGRRFAISNMPLESARGGVLFIPPFAEEMNKSRRMASLAAQALAGDRWHVLRFDLRGCGDSEGDIGTATWADWLEDIEYWANWLRGVTDGPLLIWGLRAGALLASDWLQQTCASVPLLLWQPVTSGQQHLTQFLRLRAAAEMLDASQARGVVTDLKAQLKAGSAVTVAGYTLSPELANPLLAARIGLPDGYPGAVSLLEVVPDAETPHSPAIERLAADWQDEGTPTSLSRVIGPAFWRTVEIETVPALVDETVRAARGLGA